MNSESRTQTVSDKISIWGRRRCANGRSWKVNFFRRGSGPRRGLRDNGSHPSRKGSFVEYAARDSPWRALFLHGSKKRSRLAQGVGIVTDQCMTAGRKDDSPAVSHVRGDILRPSCGAESID